MPPFTNIGIGDGPRKRSAPPPPFGAKKPAVGVTLAVGIPKKPTDDSSAQHEDAEPPEYEQREEYGAKLTQDIEAAGASVGLDSEMSRKAAGAFFTAAAKCLGGDDESTEMPMEGGDMEGMPQ